VKAKAPVLVESTTGEDVVDPPNADTGKRVPVAVMWTAQSTAPRSIDGAIVLRKSRRRTKRRITGIRRKNTGEKSCGL
jgi:hypothetical protein